MTAGRLPFFFAVLVISNTVASLDTEGDVRLQGADNTALQGRVEVYHNGAWLSICDASWDSRKGDVICRQLGFAGGAMSTDTSALFGEGTSASWLTGVTCTGTENSLLECTGLTYGTTSTCSHATDAGVRCTYPMYQGCYSSSVTGPLTDFSSEISQMTITQCLAICRTISMPKTFAGVQGMKCSCGNDISGGNKQGNSGCNIVCPGDASETCGGSATASIYRTDDTYHDATSGGYIASSNFPNPYTTTDAFDRTILIPPEFNFAVVSFSYFKLAVEDRILLRTPAGTLNPRTIAGNSDGVVPAFWNSEPADSFQVQFLIGSSGDTGFIIQYQFGKQCSRDDLPSSVSQGLFSATQASYLFNEVVVVNCNFGYQRDKEGFLCQMDGTWSQAPICSLITTTQPTTEFVSTVSSTTPFVETTPSVTSSDPTSQPATGPPQVPCPVPQVSDGRIESQGRTKVYEGDTITVICNDSFVATDDVTTAMCLSNGLFDVGLVCTPTNNVPVWLIAIIVVAAVLAIIVVVLIILVALVSSEPKHPASRRRRPQHDTRDQDYGVGDRNEPDRLVAIAPSVQQYPSADNSVISGTEGGAVNQGAQTDIDHDRSRGELADPMAGDTDVYHPTRDYPGAGARRAEPLRPVPLLSPTMPISGRRAAMDYRPNGDFSMLDNDQLLAVRALDNVVQDFERDQAYNLGPTSPGMYTDHGSRYGSRQVQFSQRSRLTNFHGLY